MSRTHRFKHTTSSSSTEIKGAASKSTKGKSSDRHTSSSTPKSQQRHDWKRSIQESAQIERHALYGQLEPITDTLIDELLRKGFKHALLLAVRSNGYLYSRKLNTFARDLENPAAIRELYQ